ncbi:MAG: hypothetical protein OXI03_07820 [Chloroflexota bacterium]|nr:hypothetical protein [Chloroflexota bacterium]
MHHLQPAQDTRACERRIGALILDHPRGSLTPAQIEGHAAAAYAQALPILLDD